MSTIVRGTGQERVNRNLEELKTDARETEQSRATRGATVVALRDGLERRTSALTTTTTTTTSSVSAPAVAWDAQKTAAAQSFATNVSLALSHLKSMSADDLTSSFMKLNVLDPNDSVSTQLNLIHAQAELARLAIRQAQDAMAHAGEHGPTYNNALLGKVALAQEAPGTYIQEKVVEMGGKKDLTDYRLRWARDQEAANKEEANKERAAAQKQLDAAIDMLKKCSERARKLLENQVVDKDGKVTDWASIDGVPVPKVSKAVNLAIGKIYKQLGDIGLKQGNAVMRNKLESVARAELTRDLKSVGMKHPEHLVDFIMAQIVMDVTGAINPGATALATGQALSDLGTALDGASGTSGSSLELAAADIAALTEGDALEAQTLQRGTTRRI